MATRRNRKVPAIELQGSIWMSVGSEDLGGHWRMGLLRAIAEHGSITHGAKAAGMSYKTAWDAIESMNALASSPLVERVAGGRGGGSTRLTPRGQQLVDRFERINEVHERFVRLLSAEGIDLGQDFNVLRMLNMRTSARNQLIGTVSGYKAGAVNDEVELALPGGARIVAHVTRESTERLGLRPGANAFALIKASSVLLATDLAGVKLSARNQLAGTVAAVVPGAVNTEVTLDIGGGNHIASVITQVSAEALGLRIGSQAVALFKASSVILGTMV
jgi:molybdate transport system regulatory protein